MSPEWTRSASLETRTARLKLPIRKKSYFVTVARGVALGYRSNAGAGTWSVRAATGHGRNWLKGFATADDYEEVDGSMSLPSGRSKSVRVREHASSFSDPIV